ncbi:hypothetical protein [Phenylobacterium sp. SCN 70-31]|uniref:hypothetical protein n=1 Tax=Phenylobacterium sp. SCN 70-31 TaxID=1660129 RepID=UPI00086E253A|nr:hypothetical protein [Phenylobacterium sp. SCN 70-31]ODT87379.1 MAG: hypothetical protein ABS78_12340 [Phenylobacterium sp. SCN 70-31]
MNSLTLEERLNQDCFCIDIDQAQVWAAVEQAAADVVPVNLLKQHRAHLFSSAPVFLSEADLAAMSKIVQAIEATAQLASYQETVLAWAPEIAKVATGPRGAFMGYDFHLTPTGPKLIEVNTNAGGAFLNALLAQAQVACCPEVRALVPAADPLADFEAAVWGMFSAEWELQGRTGRPRVVAIVDDAPADQYLYPEFLLAQAFFARQGLEAVIADPGDLRFDRGRLVLGELNIDLVYNRLVDFTFDRPQSAALKQAYLADAVVVTPNPRNHALLADKRNLTLLSDPEQLEALGVDAEQRRILAALPKAKRVTAGNAAELWAERKSLFFKPAGGHAGKAVYRGDKLTRGAWAGILEGDFIAQAFAAPSARRVQVEGDPQTRKLDVRLYTYAGETLLAAARLYQGQTTNFRTPGGGFAPVVVMKTLSAGDARPGPLPVCAS